MGLQSILNLISTTFLLDLAIFLYEWRLWLFRSIWAIRVVALVRILLVRVRIRMRVRLRWRIAEVQRSTELMTTVKATTGVVRSLEYAGVVSAIILALEHASSILLQVLIGKLLVHLITVLVLTFSWSPHLLLDLLQLMILIILLNTYLLTNLVLTLLLVLRVHEVLDPILLA